MPSPGKNLKLTVDSYLNLYFFPLIFWRNEMILSLIEVSEKYDVSIIFINVGIFQIILGLF